MPATSTVRTLSVVILVVTALLGTAYVLGRSVLVSPGPGSPAGIAANTTHTGSPAATRTGSPVDGGKARTGPPTPGTTDAPPPPAPESGTGGDHRRLPLEQGGPYGSRMTTGSSQVALTFDDGPDPRWTPLVLDLLRRHQVKATFCLVGQNAWNHPDLVRAIVAGGHTLCNHSWSHDLLLGSRSRQAIQADLIRTNQAIRAAVPDARIAYFRQPGGNWTYPVVSVASELGMTSLHWTVDPKDWNLPGAGSIIATVTGRTFPGSVVLLHDAGGDRQGTMLALGTILPNLTRRFELDALPTGSD